MKRKTGKFNALCGAVLLALALAGCGAPAGNEADAEKTAGNSGIQVTVEPGKEESPGGAQSPDGADKEQSSAGADNTQSPAGADNGQSPDGTDNTQNPAGADNTQNAAGTDEAQTVVLNEETVKLLGRTQLMLDKNLLCAFSGSGVEFDFTGRKLEVTLQGDSAANAQHPENCARVAIYVDDERVQDIMLTSKRLTVTVTDSEEVQTVRVRIVKLSETAMSNVAIRPIELQGGESIRPAEDRAHTIEFIGDSITCGYGVDDEDRNHHFSTETEDVTKAYAYKTAQALDADYSMVSISGYGIISGYTNDPSKKSESQRLPDYYEKLGNSSASYGSGIRPQTIKWDFARFVPEVVVINLGTNDASYCGQDAAKQQEYVDGYVAFLKTIREKNPDAEIFCALGIMGQDLCAAMERACEQYMAETGDSRVHSLRFAAQDGSLGIAADWHPTEATHAQAAELLAKTIRDVMGW
ncbi:MAG: GDSL family lipase [Lachnospiraceae bacterium]|nr:GDSL family lipase [Lachnospiraceae bacterium]